MLRTKHLIGHAARTIFRTAGTPNHRFLTTSTERYNKAKGSVSEYGEYVLCLGFGGLIIKTLAERIAPETWLGNSRARAVAIGFDSGDGILLGSITKTGWQPNAA